MVKKIKLKRIELTKNKKEIFVWPDCFDNLGFGFKLKDIEDKQDFEKQIKHRIEEALQLQDDEKDNLNKFDKIKDLKEIEI